MCYIIIADCHTPILPMLQQMQDTLRNNRTTECHPNIDTAVACQRLWSWRCSRNRRPSHALVISHNNARRLRGVRTYNAHKCGEYRQVSSRAQLHKRCWPCRRSRSRTCQQLRQDQVPLATSRAVLNGLQYNAHAHRKVMRRTNPYIRCRSGCAPTTLPLLPLERVAVPLLQ